MLHRRFLSVAIINIIPTDGAVSKWSLMVVTALNVVLSVAIINIIPTDGAVSKWSLIVVTALNVVVI